MDPDIALPIITALSQGTDPDTGELFELETIYNRPHVIRALYTAKHALEQARERDRKKANSPENAGKPWSEEEEQTLCEGFDAGQTLQQLARLHGRTRGSVTARLVRLGKIEAPA